MEIDDEPFCGGRANPTMLPKSRGKWVLDRPVNTVMAAQLDEAGGDRGEAVGKLIFAASSAGD